jgi:hypothetical protein
MGMSDLQLAVALNEHDGKPTVPIMRDLAIRIGYSEAHFPGRDHCIRGCKVPPVGQHE